MNTIQEVLTWPDRAVVEALQAKITKVWKQRPVNGESKTVQSGVIQDGTGKEMPFTLWGHPDASNLEGGEYIFHSTKSHNGKFGGVDIRIKPDKNGNNERVLNVNKGGQVQVLQVYHQTKGNAIPPPTASQAPSSVQPQAQPQVALPKVIMGQTVGMAINNSIQIMIAQGEAWNPKRARAIASDIIRVSQYIEAGNLCPEGGAEKPVQKQAPVVVQAPPPPVAQPIQNDEDIPF